MSSAYIQLASGEFFDLTDPDPSLITLRDIAHSLSKTCRYTGQSIWFFSVAQHSLLVADLLPPELRLEGLMHDAAEAYLGDVSSPLKQLLPAYRELEAKVNSAILERFPFLDFSEEAKAIVKAADLQAMQLERRVLLPSAESPNPWDWLDNKLENYDATKLPSPIHKEIMYPPVAYGRYFSELQRAVGERTDWRSYVQ